MDLKSYNRWYDRHALGALACGARFLSSDRPAQHDRASSVANPLRRIAARQAGVAKATEAARSRGTELPVQVRAGVGLARQIANTSR